MRLQTTTPGMVQCLAAPALLKCNSCAGLGEPLQDLRVQAEDDDGSTLPSTGVGASVDCFKPTLDCPLHVSDSGISLPGEVVQVWDFTARPFDHLRAMAHPGSVACPASLASLCKPV
jgi:hypothetical protein